MSAWIDTATDRSSSRSALRSRRLAAGRSARPAPCAGRKREIRWGALSRPGKEVRSRSNIRFADWKARAWSSAISSVTTSFLAKAMGFTISARRMAGNVTRVGARASAQADAFPGAISIFGKRRRADAARGVPAAFIISPGAWMMRRINWRCASVSSRRAHPTPVIDRFWFKSVYFRNPAAFFSNSRPTARVSMSMKDWGRLGETLVLPPWLEPNRGRDRKISPAAHPAVSPTNELACLRWSVRVTTVSIESLRGWQFARDASLSPWSGHSLDAPFRPWDF